MSLADARKKAKRIGLGVRVLTTLLLRVINAFTNLLKDTAIKDICIKIIPSFSEY